MDTFNRRTTRALVAYRFRITGMRVLGALLASFVVLSAGCAWKTEGTYEAEGEIPMLGDADLENENQGTGE